MFSKRNGIILLVALLVLGGVFFVRSRKTTKPVVTIHPQVKTLKKELEVSGVIDAKEKATLKFLAGGKVTYLGAQEGDRVKKWQTIASVDKRDLENNLRQYLNTYSSTRVDFDQTIDNDKDIHGNTAIDRALQKNQLTLENSVLNVELKDLAIKNASLYTPIDGILVTSPAKTAGVILSATDAFQIVNPTSIFFEVDVDEADIHSVYTGQRVRIVLDAYPSEPIDTTVDSIAFQSSETTNGTVFKVRMSVPSTNEELKYKLGMNGTAWLLLDEKQDVLSVPISSLIERDGKSYVEVRTAAKKIEQRQIQKGIENDDDAEIISGLSPTDEVVKK